MDSDVFFLGFVFGMNINIKNVSFLAFNLLAMYLYIVRVGVEQQEYFMHHRIAKLYAFGIYQSNFPVEIMQIRKISDVCLALFRKEETSLKAIAAPNSLILRYVHFVVIEITLIIENCSRYLTMPTIN